MTEPTQDVMLIPEIDLAPMVNATATIADDPPASTVRRPPNPTIALVAAAAPAPDDNRRPLVGAFARAIETAHASIGRACLVHADAAIATRRAREHYEAAQANERAALAAVEASITARDNAANTALVSVGLDPSGPDAASWEVRTGENAVVRKV